MCAGTLEQAFSVLLLVISTLLRNKVNKRQENLNLQSYVPLSYDPLCAVIIQISTNRKWLIVLLFHWSMPLCIDDHTQISVIFVSQNYDCIAWAGLYSQEYSPKCG